ncbi:MAG: aminotransferase class V-fold PLP-dependent enzyme [Oceanicoccus sp.]
MQLPIYLDYAATTPVDPRVAAKIAGCLTMDGVFANPASRSHIYGWQAEEQVELARRNVASLLACDPREIVWTSGATESNNLALKGIFESTEFTGGLVTSTTEHKAVIDPAKWLAEKGVGVQWLEPGSDGVIDTEKVRQAITDEVRLVSIMLVNNETGVVNPIAEIGQLCREKGVLLHVDAAQAVGRLDIDVNNLSVDLMSLSAHKFYGPKGVGALYVRRAIQSQLKPLIHGGGHERGMRSGTLATHQLAGMGEAARLITESQGVEAAELAEKSNRLWLGIKDLPGVRRNGCSQNVSPSHLNVCFSGVDGETLLLSLRELAVSSGSACTSASLEPSYVLKAMGVSDEDAHSSIRFSIGRFTSDDDISKAINHICKIYTELHQTQSV